MSIVKRAVGWLLLNDPKWTEEKRKENVLIRRLDIFFCSYISLSAIVKYLDQTNLSNAYVSGMKEDLSLLGNQYNLFTTYFNIGYIICIPISVYFINGTVRPSLWLPTAELLWGIGTAGLAAVHDAKAVYGLRFFVGFCEGTAWPGTMILLLSWYTPAEIGKRLAVYQSATSLGGIFSGALQSALYTNLNGSHGIAGWRWLFIVNACITVGVAGWGYYGCPDYPNKPNPWAKWLRKVDVETARSRMSQQKRELPKGWSWKTIKSTVTRPTNWAIWALYTCGGQGGTGTGYFNLWLKSLVKADGTKRYSVSQLNTIPIACACVSIVSLLGFLALSDKFRVQWPFILIAYVNGLIFSSILAAWKVSDATKFASFFMLNICTVYGTLIISWLGTLAKHSAEERSFLVAAFVVTYYSLTAGMPLKVWPASQAPHYKIGWKYAVSMYAAAIVVLFLVLYLERRQKSLEAEHVDEERPLDHVDSEEKLEDVGDGALPAEDVTKWALTLESGHEGSIQTRA
ncbi:major facilitator superfamily domain-containing protein [Naematelia encephala]|uniref:Major facilitator superfamily domain-containing protein n=1 Tax=Naematelia encephala TaxID=71784 RepID=A0A1Y2AJV1_9TREE|nr:major facilitator superfamily domain-containing protein [Naematelia encephala]